MKQKLSLKAHWALLVVFTLGIFGLMQLPVLLLGYPHTISIIPKDVWLFHETGVITDTHQHMLIMLLSYLYPLIAWNNVNAWVAVSMAAFCLSLLPLWWTTEKLFSKPVAWATVVIFALLPLSWTAASAVGGYGFAFLPLFLSVAAFLKLHTIRPYIALGSSGILFGVALGMQHSYLAFLPWFFAAYVWLNRNAMKRAVLGAVTFSALAVAIFLVPMAPGALQPDLSLQERVATLLSPLHPNPGTGHLYPDKFIVEHYKDAYDVKMRERVAESSFFKNQEDRNYRILFGAGEFTLIDRIASGGWLFLNNIPDFFMMDFVGGAFLWIFIVPGIIIAWRKQKLLVWCIAGLLVFMEVFLRFVLLFTSTHLNNYAWALALFAGIGAIAVADGIGATWKMKGSKLTALTICITAAIGMQMLQANRKVLAHLYAKSQTPEVYAATEVLKDVPEDAIIASGSRYDYSILTPFSFVSIRPATIEFLGEMGKIAEPFDLYGVTHIIGYSDEDARRIRNARPRIRSIALPEDPGVPELSAFIRYLLHIIR